MPRGHLAASPTKATTGPHTRRRDASGKHRKPEIELQRGEHDEDRIEKVAALCSAYTGSDLARHEQDEDARDAGLDKCVQVSQRPRHGLALLKPAADHVTDGELVAGQQDEDRKDLRGPLGSENPA